MPIPPFLPSLGSCPLHHLRRSPLTTTWGFLRNVPRTSLVFTHTLALIPVQAYGTLVKSFLLSFPLSNPLGNPSEVGTRTECG
jgi:hypothetical protein